jgi:hypothetical protein
MNPPKPLEIPTEAEINAWLNDLFSPVLAGSEVEQYKAAMFAFEELTGYYLYKGLCGSDADLLAKISKCVHFDYVGITSMLKRFQRDVYGVKRFCDLADDLVKKGELSKEAKRILVESACGLGLRITAEDPRKTRLAAAFSLWMCVFRPVSFDTADLAEIPSTALELFCASLNYWLASTFLLKFGTIDLGDSKEAAIRLERIKHDFTFRQVSISTMETLYSAIFRIAHGKDV